MIGVISIIIENPEKNSCQLNQMISDYKHLIKARMGIPYDNNNVGVIVLVLETDINIINAITGKIGRLKFATAKAIFQKNI